MASIYRLRKLAVLVVFFVGAYACGGAEESTESASTFGSQSPLNESVDDEEGVTENLTDAGPAEEATDSADAGVTEQEEIVEGQDGEPIVRYEGIVGLEQRVDLFCANNVQVKVKALNIGERPLRLILEKGDSIVLPVDPEPLDGDPNRFLFELDGSMFLIPEEGRPDMETLTDSEKAEWQLRLLSSGDTFKLTVAALDVNTITTIVDDEEVASTVLSLPEDPAFFDTATLLYDAEPPTILMTEPDPAYELPTISGHANVMGVAKDNEVVGFVEILFDDDPLDTFEPEDNTLKSYNFSGELDLRKMKTKYSEFETRVYDGCGLNASVVMDTKLIAWPWMRSLPRYDVPGGEIINDTTVADWNGDGYPDVIVATAKGIVVVYNDGQSAPGEFSSGESLTATQTWLVAVDDLDGDGYLDLVAVAKITSGGNSLAIYRNVGGQVLVMQEHHILPLAATTNVRGLIVRDFSDDDRADVVIATSSQEESLFLFKRQNEDKPQDFDETCEVLEVAPDEEFDEEGESLLPTVEYVCDNLYSPPIPSGGVADITQIEAIDLTGPNGVVDGLPDLLVGADSSNQVRVFPNRFADADLLDTAFLDSLGSYVWPAVSVSQDTRYFCAGNFLELDEEVYGKDHLDLVVGADKSGTWRVLVGAGGGSFYNESPASGPYAEMDIHSMSGTVGSDIRGLLCADFDDDNHMDFAIVSESTGLIQFHLGDGHGYFNQLPEHELLNPANEGVGFVVEAYVQNPKLADFDSDGLPDVLVDYRQGTFSIMTNTTNDELGFDMNGTRTLVTPLGKSSSSTGGYLINFAVGDVTSDGKPDVVGLTDASGFKKAQWLFDYHPKALRYREWGTPLGDTTDKAKASSTVFVWSQGTYGPDIPSYPAAYDRMPKQVYGFEKTGPTDPLVMELVDVALGPSGFDIGADGHTDIVVAGNPKGGQPANNFSVIVNWAYATGSSFWDPNNLEEYSHSMFQPFDGYEEVLSNPRAFAITNIDGGPVPQLLVATNAGNELGCSSTDPVLRVCPWDPNKNCGTTDEPDLCPYWSCWVPYSCDDLKGKKFGGNAFDILKLSVDAFDYGYPTSDPNVPGDVLVLSQGGDNMSLFRFDEDMTDPAFPFLQPQHFSVGTTPVDMALNDMDNDGLIDMAVTVKKNVLVSYGDDSFTPFEAFLPVDKRPGFEQDGGVDSVVLADLNHDGYADVVFTEKARSRVTAYLAVGVHQGSYKRQYHGPIYFPLCRSPGELIVADFQQDGCPELLVLCESSGAIAIVGNDTCTVEQQ